MFNGSNYSLSDIASICKDNDGFGGNGGAWWLIILLLFFNGGWGWGDRAAVAAGATDNYVLASDFATLQRQIDSATTSTQNLMYQGNDQLQRQVTAIGNGISSLGYDQLAQMNGLDKSIAGATYALQNGINSAEMNAMQNTNAIQSQMAEIGCGLKSAITDSTYALTSNINGLQSAMQSGFCQTNYNNQTNTRDIIDSQNSNTQSILAAINQMNIDAKDAKIADLTAQVSALTLSASQQAQNSYLISQLQPVARPAYVVQSPYTSYCGCTCACS